MARESNKFLLCGGGDGVPIGTFTWWFGLDSKIPSGWMRMDGSEFSVTDYPELYEILGTNVLPNMMGRFVKGSTIGQTIEAAGLPNIAGTIAGNLYLRDAGRLSGAFTTEQNELDGVVGVDWSDNMRGTIYFDASRSSQVYGNSDTVTPANISAIPIIKAGTKGTNLIYTNKEIDTFFDTLEQRVVVLETGTTLADNNAEAHEISPDAHDELFAEKASTTSANELTSSVNTLEANVAELAARIEQKESEMEG